MRYLQLKKFKGKLKSKTHKYNASKTTIDNIVFDSKLEAAIYSQLKNNKDIIIVETQPTYELQPKFKVGKKTILPINYKADFLIKHKDHTLRYIIDVKGMILPEFALKKKIMLYKGFPVICVHSVKDLNFIIPLIEQGVDPNIISEDLLADKKSRKKKKSTI